MTFIAKAMNKQTRLEGEADRAERDEAPAGSRSRNGAPDLEFVRAHEDRDGEPKILAARSAARALTSMNARSRTEPPALPPEMLGTLESFPPEVPSSAGADAGPWWKQPMVIGGGTLGLMALLMGFIFAPGGDPPPEPAAPRAESAALADSPSASNETGSPASAQSPAVSASGGKPVVVRVQIDSGDGGTVEFEPSGGVSANRASSGSQRPKMPEVFEPLQPLELPPPPFMDLLVDEPTPSQPARSRSTYSPPPPSGDAISDYRLEGIFWDEANPGAIINDEIVGPGKRVDQLRVLEIHKNYVVVELHGRTYDLR